MIPHNQITFDQHEIDTVTAVIKSGYWAEGNIVTELEHELIHITQRKYAIAVSSGLSALRIALLSLNVGEGDEVIIPAYSCVALANAVLAIGAIPIPVDINKTDFNIDFDKIKNVLTDKTKAIVVVHTFGAIADIRSIKTLHIPIIEDCAHAFGITTEQGTVGNIGDVTICSFYATKLIGGGEGGAILTNNITIANKARDLKDYTDKKASATHLNEKMSNIHAAVSLAQLKKLSFLLNRRKLIAENYNKLISNNICKAKMRIPVFSEQRVWYRYALIIEEIDADNVITEMDKMQIAVRKPVELWLNGGERIKNPSTCFIFKHLVSLPLYPTLSEQSQKIIVNVLFKILDK
jgi:dTDP-4-amino-4,6-dideoxygalactose transaminase